MSETKPPEQGLVLPETGKITVKDENGENKDFILTKKFNLFCQYYNSAESETFGNATRSVMKAYQLSENDYGSATVIATENLRKLSYIARDYAERKGLTLQKLIDAMFVKAVSPKFHNPGWADRFLKLTGMMDLSPTTINNTQVNIFNGKPEEKKDFNGDFQKWLESGQK